MRKYGPFALLSALALMLSAQCLSQDKKANEEKTWNTYANDAWDAGYHEKFQREVDLCREGLTLFPGNPDLRELLAEGLTDLGKYDEAEALFDKLIHSGDSKDQAIIVWTMAGYHRMLVRQNRMSEAERVEQWFADNNSRHLPMTAKN